MTKAAAAQKTRAVSSIMRSEEEFFDRIWYDRKLGYLQNIEDGRESPPPRDIEKGMNAAMLRVEKKYGGEQALRGYYSSDFEWGMMCGKLSALRWVLGDEWDNLDT